MAALYQTADWKAEKHVPVIDDPVKEGDLFKVTVSVGKEIAHPNTTQHHIRWIDLIFWPEGGKFPYQIGRTEFLAHGESTEGPDTSTVYTHHWTMFAFKSDKPGKLIATSHCNIHGLWQSEKQLTV